VALATPGKRCFFLGLRLVLLKKLLTCRLPHFAVRSSMKEKRATSFRLTVEALRLLAMLSETLGISQTGALEIAIRSMAAKTPTKK